MSRSIELKVTNSSGKKVIFDIKSPKNQLVYRVNIDETKKKQKIYCYDHYLNELLEYIKKHYPKIKVEMNNSDEND